MQTNKLKERISEIQRTIDAWQNGTDFETRWILTLLEQEVNRCKQELRKLEQSTDDNSGSLENRRY